MNNYFSHDSNARNSSKMLQVRMKIGAVGYAIYFMLLERLRDEDNYMSIKDYNAIAFDLRVDTSQLKAVVEDFGLFVFTEDGKYFYSEGFNKRMALKDAKSKKRSEAGKKGAKSRWGGNPNKEPVEDNDNAMAMPSKKYGKESKVNKSKVNKKEKRPHSDEPKYGPADLPYQVAEHLLKRIKEHNPEFKQPNLQHWSNDIRLAHERDKRDYTKLNHMIDWCQDDDFWQGNILSAKKLREKYDQLAAQANRDFKISKANVRETLPDWARRDSDQPQMRSKQLSAEKQAELEARIRRLSERNDKQEAKG